ncbi:hypothetical protein P3X46_009812 [Hevea brasiliensis]|uniref:Late embryogenesis abundant protein LEA-2 subgroup domain-containing protein n=1 Tax=Hevea brasiliensis TaxID=3981 RepID=A0ABQ9MCP7_HEVBR|nr:uncharacterized protein At1g08160 [Hevea brasiliensis]KAJ9177881.1 hypothetical protein P3X46_009812 [Hevea brasiliensis]
MADPSRPATGYPVHPAQHPNGYPPPQSATAYAPPPPNNPYYYNQPPAYPNPRAALIRRLIAALIAVTVLFLTILFICWLVIQPHRPEFHVTSFSVTNLNVSTSSQRLTGNWNARFQVYNPNKKLKISYDEIMSSILYKSEILSQTRIPPFKQDTKNHTTMDAEFSVVDSYVDERVVNGINGDRANGAVGFEVRVVADVGFKVGGFRARRRLLRVWCDNVSIGLSANGRSGNLTGGARKCKVFA